jgi:hypothetical protein
VDRTAERVRAERFLEHHLVHPLLGAFFDHREFLEHHEPLAFELDRIEARVAQDVGEHLEREIRFLVRQREVETGVFARGHRVEVAAHEVDVAGDVERASLARSLEHHVLEEVCHTRLARSLVARAALYPHADREALEGLGPFGDHDRAVLEHAAAVELGTGCHCLIIAESREKDAVYPFSGLGTPPRGWVQGPGAGVPKTDSPRYFFSVKNTVYDPPN